MGFISPELVTKIRQSGVWIPVMLYDIHLQHTKMYMLQNVIFFILFQQMLQNWISYILNYILMRKINWFVSRLQNSAFKYLFMWINISSQNSTRKYTLFLDCIPLPDVMNVIMISFLLMFAGINVLDAHNNSMTKLGLL